MMIPASYVFCAFYEHRSDATLSSAETAPSRRLTTLPRACVALAATIIVLAATI